MIDFAFSQGDWKYGLAINNGDGTFSVNNEAVTLSETDQKTNKDNSRFNMVAYDFDHDGKCDFVITKAHYVFHGGFRSKYYYDFTKTLLLDLQVLDLNYTRNMLHIRKKMLNLIIYS